MCGSSTIFCFADNEMVLIHVQRVQFTGYSRKINAPMPPPVAGLLKTTILNSCAFKRPEWIHLAICVNNFAIVNGNTCKHSQNIQPLRLDKYHPQNCTIKRCNAYKNATAYVHRYQISHFIAYDKRVNKTGRM